MTDAQDLVDTLYAAAYLHCSVQTINRACRAGELPATKFRNRWYIRLEAMFDPRAKNSPSDPDAGSRCVPGRTGPRGESSHPREGGVPSPARLRAADEDPPPHGSSGGGIAPVGPRIGSQGGRSDRGSNSRRCA